MTAKVLFLILVFGLWSLPVEAEHKRSFKSPPLIWQKPILDTSAKQLFRARIIKTFEPSEIKRKSTVPRNEEKKPRPIERVVSSSDSTIKIGVSKDNSPSANLQNEQKASDISHSGTGVVLIVVNDGRKIDRILDDEISHGRVSDWCSWESRLGASAHRHWDDSATGRGVVTGTFELTDRGSIGDIVILHACNTVSRSLCEHDTCSRTPDLVRSAKRTIYALRGEPSRFFPAGSQVSTVRVTFSFYTPKPDWIRSY